MEIKNSKKGFTIIELIIVMAIFLFIVGAALGIFLSIIQSQKKVLAEQQFLNQISYVSEYMSKALRMAKTDSLGDCLPLGSNGEKYIYLLTRDNTGIKFINQSDDKDTCQEFFFEGGVLKEEKDNDPSTITPLTSSSMHINFVKFVVNGDASNCNSIPPCGASNQDQIQPRVTILLNVIMPAESNGISTPCNSGCRDGQVCDSFTNKCAMTRTIQTTVSRRNLNILNSDQ